MVGLVRCFSQMLDRAECHAFRSAPRTYFSECGRVLRAIERLRNEAVGEYQRTHPDDSVDPATVGAVVDLVIGAGKHINDVVPITRQYFDASAAENLREPISKLFALQAERLGLLARFGTKREAGLRNSLRENVNAPLADALRRDIVTLILGTKKENLIATNQPRLAGISRLLLLIDDYEHLEGQIGSFLVNYLLPKLRSAGCDVLVLIVGRSRLRANEAGWQSLSDALLPAIRLDALMREEMTDLVRSQGVSDPAEQEKAWQETEGHPLYVNLWMEERASGGRTALMLKMFFRRTTQWMDSREQSWLIPTLFLDDVNIDTLRKVLDSPEEATEAFDWFENDRSILDPDQEPFRVRPYLRSRLLGYLKAREPSRYEELERRAKSV